MLSKRLCVQAFVFVLVAVGFAHMVRPVFATKPFPCSRLVKNDGVWVAPRGEFYGGELLLRDNDRKTGRRLKIRDLFPDKEYRLYVHDTTAGPMWGCYAVPMVVNLAGHDYLCVSFWSGKRLLVNLDTGECEAPARFDRELNEAEKHRIREILSTAATNLPNGKVGTYGSTLEGAMLLAARHQMKDAKADLDAINRHDTWSGPICPYQRWGFSVGFGRALRDRDDWYKRLELRQIAQLALRRLGYCPEGYPVFLFEKEKKSVAIDLDERREKSSEVKVGWTSQQVYDLLGPPDFMEYATAPGDSDPEVRRPTLWDDAWRYDCTDKDDHSLLVVWDDKGHVEAVKRITPALWRGDALFSEKIEKPVFGYDGRLDGRLLQSKEFLGRVEDGTTRTLVFRVRAERPVEHLGHSSAISPTDVYYHPHWYDGCFGRLADSGKEFVIVWGTQMGDPIDFVPGATYVIQYRGEFEKGIMAYTGEFLPAANVVKVTKKRPKE
ncbi:MAG: hypothetical protein GX621_02140 [Pirellulaceae bacterium]|nr:hypothetical protein [Pirellulaceae bacterium]